MLRASQTEICPVRRHWWAWWTETRGSWKLRHFARGRRGQLRSEMKSKTGNIGRAEWGDRMELKQQCSKPAIRHNNVFWGGPLRIFPQLSIHSLPSICPDSSLILFLKHLMVFMIYYCLQQYLLLHRFFWCLIYGLKVLFKVWVFI